MDTVWVLIPAYNEARAIGSVIRRCKPYCSNILVVDDGSTDGTAEEAERAGGVVLRNERNRGKGAALRTGFEWLLRRECEAVITMDGDGQHDPAEISFFIRRYLDRRANGGGGVIIIGKRERELMPRYRAVPNKIGETLISFAARRHISDTQSGYRLYSRSVLETVRCAASGFEFETEMLIMAARKGAEIEEIPVATIYQEHYKTNFRPVADFYRISIVVLKHFL